MGPVARSWLACLAVVFSACSLVVDFPDKVLPDAASQDDGGLDAGPDARADAATPDATPDTSRPDTRVPDCVKDTDCDSDDLCCFRDGRVQCVPSDVASCTACGVGCSDPRAPNCGARVCECAVGTGKGCDPGQTCSGTGAAARCVECADDDDCVGVEGKPLCDTATNKCVQCKRGDMLESSEDDVGCQDVRMPICGPSNTCIGCDDTMPATQCPGDTVCSPGLGCGGCKADVAVVVQNGCTQESQPICRATPSGLTQCSPCQTNAECRFAEGQGYCANGRCSNKCDGDGALGANGCTNPATPFCKPASGVPGGFDCAACTAADCANGTFCATTGAKAGSCVQCRADADCPQNGLAPVCDQTTFQCRARTMADCAATPATPVLGPGGACVQCVDDTQCTAGQHCSPTKNTCGQCGNSSHCPLATPTCNAETSVCESGCTAGLCILSHAPATMCVGGACIECTQDSQCGLERPLCEAGRCIACDAVTALAPTPDARCGVKTPSTRCLTGAASGAYKGRCGACVPGGMPDGCLGPATCSPTTLLCQ